MREALFEKIPTRAECHALMAEQAMLPNIAEHSIQVMRVSLAIADNLKDVSTINRDVVMAAALLHDITKTQSLTTRERHDASGGALLRSLGYHRIARIVEQHVYLDSFDFHGTLGEEEIVFYADKRVKHDRIVTIDERLGDLVERYGVTQEIRALILGNRPRILNVEQKIAGFMTVDLHQAVSSLQCLTA